MKKLVLATAIVAASITAAHAAPTVYGKVFLTLDTVDADLDRLSADRKTVERTDSSTRTKLNSTTGRIGVKGSEPLTANTDVVYQLEYGVRVDDNASTTGHIVPRDTFIGLANKQYGTVLAGRQTSVNNGINFADVSAGAVDGGDNLLSALDKPRVNNAFTYFSPSYNGLSFQGMYALDENDDNDKVFDGYYEAAIAYKPAEAPFRAGIGWMQASDRIKALRVSGDYKFTPKTTLGVLYQNTKLGEGFGGDEKENSYTASLRYQTETPWLVYGQVDYVDNAGGFKDGERQRYIVGGKYAFNKAATGHVYASYRDEDRVAGQTAFVGAGKQNLGAAGNAKYEAFGVGAGIDFKF
ncbi:porin [Moraxella sp. FZFQ2102]|uniref:porin n=1 Tax=Moraxella sp. FZFQ2102 TaxID=2953752 RepID=UPI00209BF654|nr:porin [Moraxella sp. FZFQ2102]USZ15230.1 porin [Moraxella sp. FZFQ2102]